jgi:hypothetical protein
VADSRPALGEHRECAGEPVGGGGALGSDRWATTVDQVATLWPGRPPAGGPMRRGRRLRWRLTQWPSGVQHKGPRGTGGPGCDSAA